MGEVLVYADRGVEVVSLRQTVRELERELDVERVRRVKAKELEGDAWWSTTDLLVMPGGLYITYHKKVEIGHIRAYVEGGGAFLGLCAGAYFASRTVSFEKGQQWEMLFEHPDALFDGMAEGPALGLGTFDPFSKSGAGIAELLIEGRLEELFYYAGCRFSGADMNVLGTYAVDGTPAIIDFPLGRGRVLLSGLHLEYNAEKLGDSDPYLAPLLPRLRANEGRRRILFRRLLQGLGMSLKEESHG